MFGLSKREMEKKFRRSELIIMAWRSQEVSASLEIKQEGTVPESGGRRKKNTYADAQVPKNLPDKFYNEEGDIDLRRVTGAEAYKYMMSQGVKLPVFGRG
jgi:hypothetical protein